MGISTRRALISIAALAFVIGHLLWPHVAIDVTTVTLLVVALLPWLSPLLKSVEFPGGWKIEFRDLEDVERRADAVGLLVSEENLRLSPDDAAAIGGRDPNLALAGLRLDIEKRLQAIARSRDIGEAKTLAHLLRNLANAGAISSAEHAVLTELVSLLGTAVHGARVDRRAAAWAHKMGSRLAPTLERRGAKERASSAGE